MRYCKIFVMGLFMSVFSGNANSETLRQTIDALQDQDAIAVIDRLSRMQASWLAESSESCVANTGKLLGEMEAAGWFKNEKLHTFAMWQVRIGLGASRTNMSSNLASTVLNLSRVCLVQSAESSTKESLKDDVSLSLGCLAELSKRVVSDRELENELREFKPYEPPSNYSGGFISGMDPNAIRDPAVRKAYADYLKRRDELNRRYNQRDQLRDAVSDQADSVRSALAKCEQSLGPDKFKSLIKDLKLNEDEMAVFKVFLPREDEVSPRKEN